MSDLRRAAVVGPGRLGTLVALGLAAAGVAVTRVAGGSDAARAALSGAIAGLREVPLQEVADGVDVVVLAVPDRAVAGVADELARADAIREGQGVVHLSGALGTAPLRRAALAGAWTAACHPALTAPAGTADPARLHGVVWAVTAAPGALDRARELVERLGGDAVAVAEADRARYHAALALASNAVGAAVVAARRLLALAGPLDPDRVLGPLARASVDAALAGGAPALTGPVVRGDVATLRAHLDAIGPDAPELADAYRDLQRAVLGAVRAGLDPDVAVAVADVLAADADRGA